MNDSDDLTEARASRPTIVDVATRAGVSKSLVSVVLRGKTGVSAANRAAVLRAVDELGYRPNAAARSLAQKRTHTVGALLSDLRNPWFIDLLASTRAELSAQGLNLFLAEDHQLETDTSVLDAFVEARVDGLLCLGTVPPTEQLLATARSMPTVVVSGREPDLPCVDVVTGDDRAGAARAVAHLIEIGHTRIAHLAGTGRAAELRTEGYRDQMRSHGLENHIRVEASDRSEEGDRRAAKALLSVTPRPTAILANNDYAALITMSHAESLGLTVPRDLSVVGYDNSYLARTGYIGLTSVDNNYIEMGRLAVQRLIARIDAPDAPRTVSLLDPTLRTRKTSGPPSP
ncbi:LacI family DNA-binding transcriptional regulator [Rhodococcus opacus]|uniref:LacI family DNA-binding transcriptional regulator n=1 Tax=Rhodococcus opacus TaxID=37919 RepID=UPI002476C286|nr:LacI family DNA-binding transcriptional regulator [Rhodococcus opacus]MDH6292832.1 DNA-binding LacI/PurR family transcriptional regulator [Rhodococcus opacus]